MKVFLRKVIVLLRCSLSYVSACIMSVTFVNELSVKAFVMWQGMSNLLVKSYSSKNMCMCRVDFCVWRLLLAPRGASNCDPFVRFIHITHLASARNGLLRRRFVMSSPIACRSSSSLSIRRNTTTTSSGGSGRRMQLRNLPLKHPDPRPQHPIIAIEAVNLRLIICTIVQTPATSCCN